MSVSTIQESGGSYGPIVNGKIDRSCPNTSYTPTFYLKEGTELVINKANPSIFTINNKTQYNIRRLRVTGEISWNPFRKPPVLCHDSHGITLWLELNKNTGGVWQTDIGDLMRVVGNQADLTLETNIVDFSSDYSVCACGITDIDEDGNKVDIFSDFEISLLPIGS